MTKREEVSDIQKILDNLWNQGAAVKMRETPRTFRRCEMLLILSACACLAILGSFLLAFFFTRPLVYILDYILYYYIY